MQAQLLALDAIVGISVLMKPSMCTFHRIFHWNSGFNLRCSTITSDIARKLTYLLPQRR